MPENFLRYNARSAQTAHGPESSAQGWELIMRDKKNKREIVTQQTVGKVKQRECCGSGTGIFAFLSELIFHRFDVSIFISGNS